MANPCGLEVSTGASLSRETDVADTFEVITGISEFPQFSFSAETGQCDDFDAPSGWAEFYKTGVFQAGEAPFVMNWKTGDTVQDSLYDDFVSLDSRRYRVAWADAAVTTLTFTANVTGWGKATPAGGGKITKPINLQISGEPTWS